MRRRNAVLGVIIALGVVSGCVSAEDKNLIATGSAVGQGNLKEWEKLSAEKQKAAHTNLVASYAVLDHNINGRELPAWVASLLATSTPMSVK